MPYSPEQLFALVGDVERYPEFVPWVTSMRTWNQHDCGDGVSTLDAEAGVRFTIIRERFRTRVRQDRSALTINADLISGPFRRLENRWRFAAAEAGCELSFSIDFEFGSRLLSALVAANSERAVTRLVSCFERRADQLYGSR